MEFDRITRTPTITYVLLCSLVPQTLSAQQYNPFGEIKKADENATLNMHLLPEGEFEVSKDPWGDIVRVIMPFGAWHWGSDSILFLLDGKP